MAHSTVSGKYMLSWIRMWLNFTAHSFYQYSVFELARKCKPHLKPCKPHFRLWQGIPLVQAEPLNTLLLNFAPINRQVAQLTQRNFVADFLQAKCDFTPKTAVLRFWSPFGGVGATYDDHIRLIGKRVADFLFALIKPMWMPDGTFHQICGL